MKYLYTLITSLLISFSLSAQVPTIDFETNGADYVASTNENGSASIITDDSTNGTSVAELSTPAEAYHAFELTLDNKLSFATAAKTISLDFYQADAVARDILVKVDAGSGDAHAAFEVLTTTAATAGWQTLTFDFSSANGSYPNNATTGVSLTGVYTKMFVFIDFASATASTTRIDNIGGGADGGVNLTVAPQVSAPTPTQAQADVISVYSDHYTAGVTNLNLNAFAGGTTLSEKEYVTGDKVIEMATLDYVGQQFDAVDVTGMTHIHFDYWVENPGGSVDFFLISAGLENGSTVTFDKNGEWGSVDIALTEFTVPNLSEIFQFKWDGQTNSPGGNLYIDNIYFWAPTSDNTEVTFIVDANNHIYPDATFDQITINGSWNSWGGFGAPLKDDGVSPDVTAADGIYTAKISVPKTSAGVNYDVEYVVAASGAGDGYSGWGDKSSQAGCSDGTAGTNFSFTTGPNSLTQRILLLNRTPDPANNVGDGDDSNNINWACYSDDAVVNVNIKIRGHHPVLTGGQYGLRNVGEGCYSLNDVFDDGGIDWQGNPSGDDPTAGDGIFEDNMELPYYSTTVYNVGYHNAGNGWCGDDAVSKDATTNTDFSLTIVEDDAFIDLTALSAVDADGNYLVYTSSLSVNDVNVELTMYPNPADQFIAVKSSEILTGLRVIDMTGREVIRKSIQSNDAILDLANLSTGIYFLEASVKGASKTMRFIKK